MSTKQKLWNRKHYMKKKLRSLVGGDIPTHSSLAATTSAWSNIIKGNRHTHQACTVGKFRAIRPAVEKILHVGNPSMQATVLRAVIDHPFLPSARKIAVIDSSKQQATANFLCQQSAQLLLHNRSTQNTGSNATSEKRDAAEVVMTFTAPSPDKTVGIPSKRERACIIGVPRNTLQHVQKHVMEKRRQLTAGERGVYWALAKQKKGYSKINKDLCSLLIVAFDNHPHVIVSPNAKDTIQVKNADGEKKAVRKILTQVGLGTIFSDIVRDNPTIKHKVGECAFRYIIKTLGFVRQFTDSYKAMCGCTECVGLQMPHCSLQAKCGIMHCKILIDRQRRLTKVRAKEMARGWGNVALYPTPSEAIRAGTCAQWIDGDIPHWECQTLRCDTCTLYPVPAEEAREDAGAEHICFEIYKYQVSLRANGKERRHLKLVQKWTMIGKFHCLFYVPALGRGRYHMMSYKLAAQCCGGRCAIMRGSISSHCDYGERMGLSFNKEIESGYYQNTSVSVKGVSLEWVDDDGVRHTRCFGHWLDDSKQDALATTHNMCSELCINGNTTWLVDGLAVGGTVWRGQMVQQSHIAAVSPSTARGYCAPN
jgi:hypothetical protein